MITGKLWQLHDDEALRRIEEAALRLIARTGAKIEHEGALALLRDAGGTVDPASGRCRIPEALVRKALANFRRDIPDTVQIDAGWRPHTTLGHGGSYPHLLEWPDCRRRIATVEDVRDMAKMAHVLPEFTSVGQVLTCGEVDARIEPVWNTVTRMELTDKPLGGGEVLFAENIKHLVRLGEIYSGQGGDTRFVASCDFSVSPLIFGERMLACYLEKRKYGLPHVPGTMTISGLSGPVTLAGTAAIALAELMVGWTIGYLVAPHLPAGAIVATGSLDMRTTRACFGSPEAILQDVTVVQVCRRLYGINIHTALGYVDCKTPGIEAMFEKLLPFLSYPFLTEHWFWPSGLLSAGQDYSPVQHLLEMDVAGALGRFYGHFTVSDDTLATGLVQDVMLGKSQTFLDTEHTLAHYAAEQWYPRWLDRRIWQGDRIEAAAEREMLDRINAYWKGAVSRYKPPDVDAARLKEARKVVAAAEKEKHQITVYT